MDLTFNHFRGLFHSHQTLFSEELFVIAGKDFYMSLQKKGEEADHFMAILRKYSTISECMTLLQVLHQTK